MKKYSSETDMLKQGSKTLQNYMRHLEQQSHGRIGIGSCDSCYSF